MSLTAHHVDDSACEPGEFETTNPIDNIVGETFGKYVLVGEIAVGGMAEVFLGVQRGLEGFLKVVVVKRVLPHFTSNEQFVRMFVAEARIAARLDHPNIVRTYEFGANDGQYYTVMEYLPGEDLRSILRRLSHQKLRLPLHLAVGMVMQLCAGLHCAHELTDTAGRPLDLVHRDVNPANIIVTYGGEVKIIDFGVAKTTSTATVTGTIKGKLAYMPPEQVLARGVDRRADVFSTGVVLWELLTGRRLFGRTSDAATLYAIMNDPVAPPSRYRSDVPRELDAIVLRALARSPNDRFTSAEELAAALEQFMATQPTYDARAVASLVEELFGTPRAAAKRAISQTRSLGQNIALVMKLRTEVHADLALETLAAGSSSNVATAAVPTRKRTLAIVALMAAAVVTGIVYAVVSADDAQTAPRATGSLLVESEPSGAAISIGGEPTGLKTPATLGGLAAKTVTIRLDLAGYAPAAQPIDVPHTGTVTQRFALVATAGRLVVWNLPRGASVVVDGTEYAAGEVIGVERGKHDVRIVVGKKPIATQQIETTAGDQRWKFVGDRLVAN